ncbi:hypothetical protein J2T21_003000 [Paeniglutamicibacter psychrophenolicus]|nr:hypothetical protein [Paeniglutamicibacter psychrophenolicus]
MVLPLTNPKVNRYAVLETVSERGIIKTTYSENIWLNNTVNHHNTGHRSNNLGCPVREG